MTKLLWILLTSLAAQALGYRILVMFPMPAKSHGILGEGVVRHLLDAGHQVTYLTATPIKPRPNLEQIDVSANYDLVPDNLLEFMNVGFSWELIEMTLHFTIDIANTTLHNENVVKLFTDTTQKFDAVIVEWMFSELYAGVPLLYDCPSIWMSTMGDHYLITSLIDEQSNPAYVAHSDALVVPPFSFWERTKQFFIQHMTMLLKYTYITMIEAAEYESYYGPLLQMRGKTLPSFQDAKYNISMFLGNSHPALGEANSLPQNFKSVGGYHIQADVKPLPEDLKKIMDNAKYGVIYFSLGSNVKSKDLPEDVKKGLITMLGGLKQTVIWKFEDELDGLPDNLHIIKWAPQQSILAHPNCVLFITHGGLLSIIETIHSGKPIIGMPVFADQHTNMYRAEKRGYGLRVSLSSPNLVEELKVAIEEILGNKKYSEKVKELSVIYHDRPVKPGQELVHWVEHVVRTRGAYHLRSPALHVPFYQKMYLDLAAVILIIALVLNKIINRLCCSKKKVNQKKKKN